MAACKYAGLSRLYFVEHPNSEKVKMNLPEKIKMIAHIDQQTSAIHKEMAESDTQWEEFIEWLSRDHSAGQHPVPPAWLELATRMALLWVEQDLVNVMDSEQ